MKASGAVMTLSLWVLMLLTLYICGCSSLYMSRLPIKCQVIDRVSQSPISDVKAMLSWRTGFGGITWGKPVVLVTDSNGYISVTAENIPAIASTGYPLKKPLRKIMIERLTLKADGYQTLYIEDLKLPLVVKMQRANGIN